MHLRPSSIACLAAASLSAAAQAGIRPRTDRTSCTPGGIAAIPLERSASDAWPPRVPVRVGGLDSAASVVWVGAVADDGTRAWTRSPERFDARAIAELPESPAPESVGEVFALVPLPAAGEGSIEVAGIPVRVDWLPLPRRVRADAAVLPVLASAAEDRPDAATPAEHWRWSVLAERQGLRAGEPRGDAADRMVASYLEGLWLGGLERVRSHSPGIHAELTEILTGTAEDRELGRPVAAWLARPGELRSLLALLIDPERTDAEVADAALSWCRARWVCTAWVEADAGDRVLVAIANPTGDERVLRAAWRGSAGESEASAIVVPPRRITRAWLQRPSLPAGNDILPIERSRPESIELSDGGTSFTVAAGGREYPVSPPGLATGAFMPPLSLADAQAGTIQPVDPAWRTNMSMRKRGERWELMVEAFRPAGAPDPSADRVTVRIGDPSSPTQELVVSGDGSLEMVTGPDDGVAAGFMSWGDRWRARIELPEAWLPASSPGARPFMMSLERTPGSVRARQTAGIAMPPWSRRAASILVDLAAWDDLGR